MSARSEWQQFHRLCRVQSETEYPLLDHNCNPRYREAFAKYVYRNTDWLEVRAGWNETIRGAWWKRQAEYRRTEKRTALRRR